MIGLFFDRRGYVTAFTLVTSLALITSVFLSINTGKYFYEQNSVETAADSIAISLATWESRGLNAIAILNYGMSRSVHLIRVVLLLWVSSIGLALSGNPSLFFHLSKKAPAVIRKLWDSGVKFSNMAKKIKKAVPPLMLACLSRLLKYYNINGFLYPSIPAPGRRSDAVLRLCLEDGEPLTITGIMGELRGKARSHRPKSRFKRFFFKRLTRIFFSQVRFLFALKGEIIPQVTERDFHEKQVVYFVGYSGSRAPLLGTIFNEKYRNYAVSCAKPYGGTSFKAAWKSRRVKPESKTVQMLTKRIQHGQ